MPSSSWDRFWTESSAGAMLPFDAPAFLNLLDQDKIEFILPHISAKGRALEIGCGSARLLARLGLNRPYSLSAVDTSLEALQTASHTSSLAEVPIRLVCADAVHLPFGTGTFDVVLSGGLLEHFRDPVPVLREMVRVLRPGGILYADVVPRKFSFHRFRELGRMLRSEWLAPGVFESAFNGEFYRQKLVELGCKEVVVQYRGVYPPYAIMRIQKYTSIFDGTFVARLFGWYFVVRGRKVAEAVRSSN